MNSIQIDIITAIIPWDSIEVVDLLFIHVNLFSHHFFLPPKLLLSHHLMIDLGLTLGHNNISLFNSRDWLTLMQIMPIGDL